MDNENKTSMITVITSLIAASAQQLSDLFHLVVLETKLAGRTLVTIVVLVFIMGSVISTTWLSMLAILFFYLVSIHVHWIAASVILCAINLLTLAILLNSILKIKPYLTYPATREHLNPKSYTEVRMPNETVN